MTNTSENTTTIDDTTKKLISEQYSREVAQFRASTERYRRVVEETRQKCERLDTYKALINQLVEPLVEGIEEDIVTHKQGAVAYYDAKEIIAGQDLYAMAYMTLRFVLEVESDERYLRDVCEELGRQVADHIRYVELISKLEQMTKEGSVEDQKKAWSTLKLFRDKVEDHGDTFSLEKVYKRAARFVQIKAPRWKSEQLYHIGQILIAACIKYTGVVTVQKSYRQITREGQNPRIYILVPTEEYQGIIEDLHGKMEILKPAMLPMICKPRDWTSFKRGGFLTNGDLREFTLVRSRKRCQKEVLKKGNYKKLFDVVNKLQSTPWKVNRELLDVLTLCWEMDKGIGKLPPQTLDAVIPPKPWTTKAHKKQMKQEKDPVYLEFARKCRKNIRDWNDKQTQRKTIASRIAILNEYKDRDAFWYTYFCDYRLRLYPVQNVITPQGDDTAKATIMFANGEPFETEKAVWWWKIHGANCFGVDKVSFDDRVQWVDDHHDRIMDSALNPLGGEKFWQSPDCDKPFCFLAWCFEYRDWVHSGQSLDFETHIPIAMDGSCNGMQHLCAMSRSMQGKRVNLIAGKDDKPADFYSDIAAICEDICEEWMYDPTQDEKTRGICQVLKGKISRKLVKRPAMTTAYSATFQGYIDQIKDEIKKQDAKIKGTGKLFECEYRDFDVAVTLAKIVSKALLQGMTEPMRVMEFIQHMNRCCNMEEKHFEWKTPMGMIVTQAYTKTKQRTVKSWFGDVKVRVSCQDDDLDSNGKPKINTSTAKNGAAPNFVHSMDSAHLQKVLLRGWDEGIHSWAMIHDSYGCHPRFVQKMQEIIREEFVNIYSRDVLQDLYEYTKARLDGEGLAHIDDVKPLYGDLDISMVQSSPYFFS